MFVDIVMYANNFETKEKWKSTEVKKWTGTDPTPVHWIIIMWRILPLIVAKCLEQDLSTNYVMLSLSHNK